MSETRVLLPTDVIPSQYSVHLTPDLKNFTFHGEEKINVQVKRSTSTITIHALDVKVLSVSYSGDAGSAVSSSDITYDAKSESVTFTFPSSLPTGNGVLSISYDGNLNDKMVGFYRSKYTVNGEDRYMGTTQMEPTGARRAFPCWDEPAHKATFEFIITAAEHLTVLSNMEPVDRQVSNALQTVKFAPTPIMSSYLAAFVVGEFDYVEDKTKEGTKIRVFTPLGKKEQGLFGLDCAVRCLSYYNDYYGIQYPLPKLDMIAIPDFSAGAMENWGLVTYRETALLIDEKTSGVASKQRVAYVIAHELAHQWFGNLVTMEWWKELWLNEGFATFVGNQATDFLFPEWDTWVQFVSTYQNRAWELDSLESSHPIEVEVFSSAQIDEIFDAISYCKGASVIRMISDIVGEANFRKGLNIYLNQFAYKNAVTEDLWNALSKASGFQVKEFMDPFTKKTGYPLVTIESVNGNQITVSQERFLSSGKQVTGDKWWLNLRFVGASNPKEVKAVDFKDQKQTLTVDSVKDDWFKVNAGQSGFFRVKYPREISKKLSSAISSLALPATDRIGIQADAFALAKSGHLPTVDALELAQAYTNEVDTNVWTDLATNLNRMGGVWKDENNYPEFQTFVRKIFGKIGGELGWDPKEGESNLKTLLRSTVLSVLGHNKDEKTIAEAKKRFEDQVKNNKPISADLRSIVYALVVSNGDKNDFETVYSIFKNDENPHQEKLRALSALTHTKDKELYTRVLGMALNGEVKPQDIMYVTSGSVTSKMAKETTWTFFKDNFKKFQEILGDSMMVFERVVTSSFGGFVSEEKAVEVEEFFKANPVPSASRGISQNLENMRANAKWIDGNRAQVAKWLSEQQ